MKQLHIETIGSGPALVLLHGWALNGAAFAPLVERLSARFQLHIVDLPGHGLSRDSDVPLQLNAAIDDICARTPPAVWIGWSMGGLFALKAAATQAQHVRGLVMLSSTPRIVKAADFPDAVGNGVLLQLADDLRRDYAGTVERFFALDVMGNASAGAIWKAMRPQLFARGAPAPFAIDDGLLLLERTDLRTQLETLPQPSLWLAGARDKLASPAAMRASAASNPRAQFAAVPHAGHAPFVGQADEAASRIAAFAQSL